MEIIYKKLPRDFQYKTIKKLVNMSNKNLNITLFYWFNELLEVNQLSFKLLQLYC